MQTFPAANPFVRWFHYHYNRLTPKNQVGFAFFAEKGRNVPRRATAVAFERIRRGREPRTRCLREVRDALAGRGLDARRFSALPLNSRPAEREGRLHRMAGIAGMTSLRTVIPRGSRCTRGQRARRASFLRATSQFPPCGEERTAASDGGNCGNDAAPHRHSERFEMHSQFASKRSHRP